MEKLSEYCLEHIFAFLTPLDWVQTFQVSRLWRSVTLKQWKKITEIIYLEDELEKEKKRSRENAPLITAKDAEKIIRCAAPFVQSLRSTYSESNGKQKFIMFGPYWFKVEGLKTYQTIKLLAQKATKITELRCDRAPRVELLQLLFENNKIKKLRVIECTAFYTNIPTEEIEDLDVRFIDRGDFRSFQGLFPNLRKLSLAVDCSWRNEPAQILSEILPYTVGIKTLNLYINVYYSHTESYKILWDITKFSQLEELSIEFGDEFNVKSMETFLGGLVISCPKLRVVKLHGDEMKINKTKLHSLLSISNLEKLDVRSAAGFGTKALPELSNLTDCSVYFSSSTAVTMTGLCSAIKKMPKLLKLKVDGLSEKQTLKLVCEAAVVAASQDKEVIINKLTHETSYEKLKIARKEASQGAASSSQIQTLNLLITDYNKLTFFKDVKAFVEKKMKQHNAFVFENE